MQRNARSVADWRRKLTNGEKMKEFHLGGIDNVQEVVEVIINIIIMIIISIIIMIIIVIIIMIMIILHLQEFHLGGIDNVQGVVEAKKLEEVFPLDWDHLCCETDKKSNIQIKSKNFSGPVEQIQKI